jgi:phosphate transport system protein
MAIRTRGHFDRAIASVAASVTEMADRVAGAITRSVRALQEQDAALADQVVAEEASINHTHDAIEDSCVQLLATEQPVATDLRRILGFIAVVANLERIGDNVAHIARVAQRLASETPIRELDTIPRMAQQTESMVRDAVSSFNDLDTAAAQRVSAQDNEVDEAYSHVFRELLTHMTENPENASQATSLSFVAKQLERIGDHTTNICEGVVFVTTGKHVDLNR